MHLTLSTTARISSAGRKKYREKPVLRCKLLFYNENGLFVYFVASVVNSRAGLGLRPMSICFPLTYPQVLWIRIGSAF